jgi:hypothetical protein
VGNGDRMYLQVRLRLPVSLTARPVGPVLRNVSPAAR